MKKSTLIIRKWTARALVAVGALLGFLSCGRSNIDPSSAAGVYGPPSYFGIPSEQDVEQQPMAVPDTTKAEGEQNKNSNQ